MEINFSNKMEISLLTISKQCSDVLSTNAITLSLQNCITSDIYDQIYDLYPRLDTSNYKVYWRFNEDTFYEISNYLSYITVLTLMFDKTLYLVINDCDEHCDENEQFLRKLDRNELAEQKERERDIYDVKIIRPGEEEEEEEVEEEEVAVERNDTEIILYAIRKLPEPKYYTADLILKANLAEDLKRGWKKVKKEVIVLPEEVIERKIVKAVSSQKESSKGGKK